MKPQFYKTGVINTSEFLEPEALDLITTRRTMSYIPVKDTNNSCLGAAAIVFNYDGNITASTKYRVIVDVSWSGFDASSTAGTFDLYWQGSTRKIETSTWVWEGGNNVCAVLNNQQSLKTLVLSATSGNYIYNTTFTLSDSWRSTYNGSNIGFRANYSNGVGKITINSILIVLDKYSVTSTIKQRFGKEYISTEEFIEY